SMKEPIEDLFKESLKGHEMPYNPEAWKAMSARLDAVSPVVQPTSYLKYYLGAAGVGAVAIATYFIFAGGSTSENTKEPIAKQETTSEQTTTGTTKASTTKRDDQSSDTSTNSSSEETTTSSDEGVKGSSVDDGNTQSKVVTPHSSGPVAGNEGKVDGTTSPKDSDNSTVNVGTTTGTTPITTHASTTTKQFTLPAVADLCLNEETTITNPNSAEMYILDAINTVVETIPANKAVVFAPKTVGNYSLGYTNDGTLKTASNFVVNRIPDASFTMDLANKYNKGLPVTHVEAINGEGTYTWSAQRQTANGVETDLHFYTKGEKTITLTVDNGQCSSSVEKTIYVEDDYNLIAVNAFTPTSSDLRNQTFMPFALTQRTDANFVLTIIDSRDGGVVYQTSDASLPWDGTDMRSGRRSETPQVYAWKVVMLNPAANEPTEYRGTITMN
ncbi:MAG: hypothetical protein AB8B56_14615, partial [Crocinitomicaceae bacterium]